MTVIEDIERTYGHNTADAFLASLYVMKHGSPTGNVGNAPVRREVVSWMCVRMLQDALKEDGVTDMVNHWSNRHRIEDDTEGYQHYWWDTVKEVC